MADKFLKQAIRLGLCEKWQDEWEESGLVEKYIKGITWCMKNEFPSLKDMARYDKALLRNGIYNGKTADIKCERQMYVFNSSNINFEIGGYDVCRIYAGRGSKLNVIVRDNAILYIDDYGCDISVQKDDTAKCRVWGK